MNKYNTHTQFPDIWISKIPAHWQVHKMKRLFAERSEKGYPNEPLLVASQTGLLSTTDMKKVPTPTTTKNTPLMRLGFFGSCRIRNRSN